MQGRFLTRLKREKQLMEKDGNKEFHLNIPEG